jgi:hypothetical protein
MFTSWYGPVADSCDHDKKYSDRLKATKHQQLMKTPYLKDNYVYELC